MVRPPCCDKLNVKRGLWTAEEDAKILAHVSTHGIGNWTSVPKKAGLKRCGKSCRLRWTNYLRPDLKQESFTPQEEELIITLHATIGSRWSIIANQLQGRTDNDVKNYWNTKLRKKLLQKGIDPITHKPISHILGTIGVLPRNRLTSLNRDLKNVFLSKPQQPPPHQPTIPNTTNTFFQTNPALDLLAQFHAIKLVTDASNFSNHQPIFQSYTSPNYEASSSSTPAVVAAPRPSDLDWSDFLLEDALLNLDGDDIQTLSSTGSSSNQMQDDAFGPSPKLKLLNGESKSCSNVVTPTPTINGASESCGATDWEVCGVSPDNSFINAFLDRDSEMSWEFPEFLEDHFNYP